MREIMRRKLIQYKLPFANKIILSRKEKYARKLLNIVRRELPLVPSEVAMRLCNNFLDANSLKPEPPLSSFIPLLRQAIPNCNCPFLHECGRLNLFTLTPDLNRLLIKELALSLDANSSSLGHSNVFHKWCSSVPADRSFGALGSLWETDLAGKNSLIVWNDDEKSTSTFTKLIDRIDSLIKPCNPARILLICPSPNPLSIPKRSFISLASIPQGFPLIFSESLFPTQVKSDRPFSIILIANKESFLYDPINWHQLKQELQEWGALNCPSLVILEEADNLFNERSPLSHLPRISSRPPLLNHDIYHFFDPEVPCIPETNFLMDSGIPLDIATKISKINNHPRGLSLLGILPNQIRHLLRLSGQDVDVAFGDISMELFWLGFGIWSQRKIYNDRFWKNIAPDQWKISPTKTIGRPAKNRSALKSIADKCRNPFHFLKRRQMLSSIRPTPCVCYKAVTHNSKFVDISFFRIPVHSSLVMPNIDPFSTREDLIRSAHDRSRISANLTL